MVRGWQQITIVARHVVKSAVQIFANTSRARKRQTAVCVQSCDESGDVRGIRCDEKTIDAIANPFGKRAEPRGDDRNPETNQFGQRVTERFRRDSSRMS